VRPDEIVDATIIGGGPAGATVARLLASWGRNVRLLTRSPSRHTLAESLPPSCGRLFDRLDVRQAVDDAGFVRTTGNTAWWGSHEPRIEQFDGTPGYQVLRTAFDRVLLAEAERAGVRLDRGVTVSDLTLGNVSELRYETRGKPRTLRSRWVLDCSGRAGLVARRGWRRSHAGARTMALVCVWERRSGWHDVVPDETHTLVESYPGGWAWSVPSSRTRRYFTLMVDPELTSLASRDELVRVYQAEIARTEHLAHIASRGTLVAGPWARDASSYDATVTGETGVLLVGDASSFVDPLSSFGVKKACVSGWLSAVVVHSALADERLTSAGLALHTQRERAMYESLQRRFTELSRETASAYASEFWRGRAEIEDADSAPEPDVAALRADPEVLVAFEEVRRRPSITLRASSAAQRVGRPLVRDNMIVLDDHLVTPGFPNGIRYLRSIDLVRLSDLAPHHSQVPDLFDAYIRGQPGAPPPLPDFLGALSVMIGKGMLEFAE
jgi:flavin-dependent dehydrogenase